MAVTASGAMNTMSSIFTWLWNNVFVYIWNFIINNDIVKMILGTVAVLIVLRFTLPFAIKLIKGMFKKTAETASEQGGGGIGAE